MYDAAILFCSFLLMCVENALCDRSGLKECECQKYRIAHDSPKGSDDIGRKCYALDKHCIDSYTHHDQKSLEAQCKQ